MNRRLLVALAAAVLGLVPAASASATPARTVTITPDSPSVTWTGTQATGFNTSFFFPTARTPATCDDTEQYRCDDTLVHISGTDLSLDALLRFRIEGYDPAPSDFDLRVYASDETGELYDYLGSPTGDVTNDSPLGGDDPRNTWIGDFETKDVAPGAPDEWYVVRVVYFTVVNGTYQGKVTATGLS